jgi:hypothetical protein
VVSGEEASHPKPAHDTAFLVRHLIVMKDVERGISSSELGRKKMMRSAMARMGCGRIQLRLMPR